MNENIDTCIVCNTMHYCENHHIFKRENSDITITLCRSCHLKLEKMNLSHWSPEETFSSFFTLFNKADMQEKLLLLKITKLCIKALEYTYKSDREFIYESERNHNEA